MSAGVTAEILHSEDGTEFAVQVFAQPFNSEKDALAFTEWLAAAIAARHDDMLAGFALEAAPPPETIN